MDTAIENELGSIHWHLSALQYIDVGMTIVDKDFNIQLWNSYMENHSGLRPDQVLEQNLFSCFNEIDEVYLRQQAEAVFALNSKAYINWQSKPYLFPFKNPKPISGQSKYMYQNITLMPLSAPNGVITHMAIMLYDVTEQVLQKKRIQLLEQALIRKAG